MFGKMEENKKFLHYNTFMQAVFTYLFRYNQQSCYVATWYNLKLTSHVFTVAHNCDGKKNQNHGNIMKVTTT